MTIYNYSPKTFEYLYQSEVRPDPLDKNNYLIPANATKIKPLERKKGYAVVFNKESKKWEYVEDYRGQTVYNTEDKRKEKVNYLGKIKKGWTLKQPCDLCVYDSNKQDWVKDHALVKNDRQTKLENLMQNSYLFIKKIAMKKPFLRTESAINEQYNSYNTMYSNALKGLFDADTNNSIIQAHEEAEQRVAQINFLLNNIRAKFEYMIENDADGIDELLNEAMHEQIKVEDNFTISEAEIQRLKEKYKIIDKRKKASINPNNEIQIVTNQKK